MDKLKQNIILFDLDGTLTDSKEGIIRCAQYMQEKMGIRIWADEELYFLVGPPLIDSFTGEFAMDMERRKKPSKYSENAIPPSGCLKTRYTPAS